MEAVIPHAIAIAVDVLQALSGFVELIGMPRRLQQVPRPIQFRAPAPSNA
jgi:hypothetical protein